MLVETIKSHSNASLILQVLLTANNVVSYEKKPANTHAYFTASPGWLSSQCAQQRRVLQSWEQCDRVWWSEGRQPTIKVVLRMPPQVVKDAMKILKAEALPQRQKKAVCG
jgi:hypothetical protein